MGVFVAREKKEESAKINPSRRQQLPAEKSKYTKDNNMNALQEAEIEPPKPKEILAEARKVVGKEFCFRGKKYSQVESGSGGCVWYNVCEVSEVCGFKIVSENIIGTVGFSPMP